MCSETAHCIPSFVTDTRSLSLVLLIGFSGLKNERSLLNAPHSALVGGNFMHFQIDYAYWMEIIRLSQKQNIWGDSFINDVKRKGNE